MCKICSASDPVGFVESLSERELSASQRTEAWYKARRKIITASETPTILLNNAYENPETLLRSKVSGVKKENWFMSQCCAHGNQHESEAIMKYEKATGHKCIPFGLIRHPEHTWLAASPDSVTYCGRNVEIKCPFKRRVFPKAPPPKHYLDQMQCQMHCLGKDCHVTDFVQWQTPIEDEREEVFDIQEVKRNKSWFVENELRLRAFHQKLLLCFMDEMKLPEEETKKRKKTCDDDYRDLFLQDQAWLADY